MTDTKRLQAILDGQSAIKEELGSKIEKVGQRLKSLEDKVDKLDRNLTSRIDKLGLQIANLEDDAPTIGEFDDLEKRVTDLEEMIRKPSTSL